MTRVTSVPKGGSVRLGGFPYTSEEHRAIVRIGTKIRWLYVIGHYFCDLGVTDGWPEVYLLHPDDALHLHAVLALDPQADVRDYVRSLLANAPKEGTDHVQTP